MKKELKTSIDGKTLRMEWTCEAPRDSVFAAFTEKEQLEAWWGPEGWETTIKTFEFQPGGVWHYCMRCVDPAQGDFYGMESWGKAIFRHIDAPNTYSHADYFSDASGAISEHLPGSENVTTFLDYGETTLIVFESTYETEAAVQEVLGMGMKEGFTSQLYRLDRLLVKQ